VVARIPEGERDDRQTPDHVGDDIFTR
jgi:hypothetical protein